MSQFNSVDDGEIIWVVDNPEECERQMKENNGMYSGNLRPMIKNPEVFQLLVVPPSEDPDSFWDSVMSKIRKESINVRSDVIDRTKTWKKRKIRYFAAIYNTKSGDAPVMALLSQVSDRAGLYINLITTNSPIMPRPYVKMLQNALREFAKEKLDVELLVPSVYQTSDEAPIVVENQEGILMSGEDVLTTVNTDQENADLTK